MKKSNLDKYTYRIEWSDEDQLHIGRCLEFPSLSVHGPTPEKALKEIEYLVSETIKWLQEEKEPVPEPFGLKKFKGNLTLRISPEMHRYLALRSAEEGVSLNQYIVSKLS